MRDSVAMTIALQPPARPLPEETACPLWEIRRQDSAPLQLANTLEAQGYAIDWQSETADKQTPLKSLDLEPYDWPSDPTILALVPHWRCEPWLSRCLETLCRQTCPLTHIVVIDDASSQPPIEIVQTLLRRYTTPITLLQSSRRVGPYNLIQSVIERTNYTAYLFQDADDWSSCDRLQTLLQTARENCAELVGSQEVRLVEPEGHLQGIGYPLDVNLALKDKPGHALLHPTSLVTRSAVMRVGGFATGLRFGADSEFLLRAHWQVRAVNSDRFCYFRRKRPHSLTTAPDTGLDSPARVALLKSIKQRAGFLSQQATAEKPLDLRPLCRAVPASLHHVCGPSLNWYPQMTVAKKRSEAIA